MRGEGRNGIWGRRERAAGVGNEYHAWPLMQAVQMRSLVVVLDGIDEAAGLASDMTRLAVSTLAPLGIRIFATSSPDGYDRHEYTNENFVSIIVGCAQLPAQYSYFYRANPVLVVESWSRFQLLMQPGYKDRIL